MAHYVNNIEFTKQLTIYYKERRRWERGLIPNKPPVSDYIGRCILQICNGLALKPNWFGYSYRQDMVSDAIEKCCAAVDNFNPRKSKNAFAYFTMIAWRSFLWRIERESFQTYIKLKNYERLHVLDEIMESDMDPNQKITTVFTDAFVEKFEEKMKRKRGLGKKKKTA